MVHVAPSGDVAAVTTLPARWSRTQTAATPVPPAVLTEIAPYAPRRWNGSPFAFETNIDAWGDFCSMVARIIAPALVQLSLPARAATRATIVPAPRIVRYTNRN